MSGSIARARPARIVITFAALSIVSSGVLAQKAEKYAPAYPRDGALVLADNARVTIWEVLHEKGKRSPMYELPLDQVSVTLTEGAVKFTRPDGTSRIDQLRLGLVRFESKRTVQQDEGLNDITSRETVFQLKDYVPPAPTPMVPGIPGQFPRIDAVKLFENDRINVWDQVWLHDRPITDHLHYTDTFTVFIAAGKLLSRDFGKPPNPPFARRVGELLSSGQTTSPVRDVHDIPVKPAATGGASSTMMVPHEEEWVEGNIRAIWVEFKYGK